MPRPRRTRRIFFDPRITHFMPAGFNHHNLDNPHSVILTREELEAVRLIDYDKTGQKEAAKKMNISQPTLSRLLVSAREKISTALIDGLMIKIKGGNFEMVNPEARGRGLRRGFKRPGGRGRMGGVRAGPGGVCKCSNPDCGHEVPQVRGVPCSSKKCPRCGSLMMRKI
jgi:predicted DNA-binding protein (UPF0251 family)